MKNIFNLLFKLPPQKLYLLALCVSSVIALWSYSVGAGIFAVQAVFEFPEGDHTAPRDIPLGYVQHLNFGPWHIIFCPFLFSLAGLLAVVTDRFAPGAIRDRCSFLALGERPVVAWVALVLLVLFVGKNLLVEITVYKDQSLGWVRADRIAEISRGKDPRLAGFSWVVDDHGILRKPTSVLVKSVTPSDLRVRSRMELVALIAVAKAWVGVWEALVVYLALLASWAGTTVLGTIAAETAPGVTDGAFGVRWARTPMLHLLIISCIVNISHIMRAIANINKATYGTLDQVISLITLAPGLVAFYLWLGVINRVHLAGGEADAIATKPLTLWFGVWSSTIVFVAFLVSGYFDPTSQKQVVQVVNQINPTTVSGPAK
jgi:hypothetical protein